MAEKKKELSGMMKHYLSMKEKYKDCVVFYRLGDFYEMFFEDAVEVSKLLDLTLTGKECGLAERAPMCGVPYHAADGYVAKLVSLGKKVAICEQISDPKAAGKNLVERDVVRIVSAGTVIEEEFLDASKSNYVACAFKTQESVALAWTDITTGEFFASEFKGKNAIAEAVSELLKMSVVEVICNEDMLIESRGFKEIQHGFLPPFSCYMPWAFNVKHAESNLLEQFKTSSLAAFGISAFDNIVSAAGALIEYLRETQKHALANINGIKLIDREEYMQLDSIAVKNLELVKNNAEGKPYGSLLWVLNKTKTGMGARLLNRMVLSPLRSVSEINARQDAVEELLNAAAVRAELAETLDLIGDVERLAGKIANGNFNPKNCLQLATSLNALPKARFHLAGFTSALLQDVNARIPDMHELAELLTVAINPEASTVMKDGGYIREGFNSELDELRNINKTAKKFIEELEVSERERTGIRTLKTGYNRVFGYYIEISNSFKDKVPVEYIRKQTITTGERYITEELKAFEEKVLTSSERALQIETTIYEKILSILTENIDRLQRIAGALALLDCLVSFATVAKERKYSRPTMVEAGNALSVTEGRHPVVEAISKERFVPNDTLLDNGENRCMIITGPNMAGKSTYMRQVALITIMAQIGSFVPAKTATIPIVDRIFTRVGASDNLIFDQSTFMVEMTEVASILLRATANSLLVLDEVGRGTSTYDGLSIAWAVIEFLTKNIQAKTLFSTHYHELTELESSLEGVKNYKVTVRELNGAVVFLRKIVRGGANRSFGIEVAALAGVPQSVTARAKSILKALEKNDLISGKRKISEMQVEEEEKRPLCEVERILVDTDVNTLSPMQALMLLNDLKEKIHSEN